MTPEHSTARPAGVIGIDYGKLVEDAWSLHKYRCGTPTCIAFKELREALDAGPTDGPWKADRWTSDEGGCYGWSFSAGGYLLPLSDMETDNPDECDANARHIAAANPAVIRSLLAELDAARKDAERMALQLLAAANYIDALGGTSKGYRAAIDAMKEQQP